MNRQQRRAQYKGKKLVLRRIVLTFEDGTVTMLDPLKVQIIDRQTNKPIFQEEK